MPCVSVRNNHARKASIKAANIERKNNRENTRLAKKQQSAAAKAQKVRQSLEKRVTKKHQAHRAKVKTARAKAAKLTAKAAKLATKTATKTSKAQAKAAQKVTKRAARAQTLNNATKKLKNSTAKLKTSVQKPAKALKASLKTAKSNHKTRRDSRKAQKAARAQARTQARAQARAQARTEARAKAKTQSSQTPSETSRTAKISGASVQNSFKIPHARAESHGYVAANKHIPTRTVTYPAAPAYTPKPLRRTAFMTRGDLINAESRLGSTIFGPVPAGHRREFFHDQENIWIWFESWHDETDHPRQLTVRYEVRPSGVYKKISAGAYFKLAGDELENFRRATHAYLHIVKKYLYPNVTTK